MADNEREADADRLSAAALKAGDPTGWFEQLYAQAAAGQAVVPWDRGEPNPLLVEWAAGRPAPGRPQTRPGGRHRVGIRRRLPRQTRLGDHRLRHLRQPRSRPPAGASRRCRSTSGWPTC